MIRHKIIRFERGFSLVEMLIVIALIGLIGTFVITNVTGKFIRAKADSTKIVMRQLGVALDDFYRECGFYPTTDQGLDALVGAPQGRECKNFSPDGYLKGTKVPKDPFGNDFLYESDGMKYVITSLGNDGKQGGEGNEKDIRSDELD